MAIQIQGATGGFVDGGGTPRAIRVQPMPVEYGMLGSYRRSQTSGTAAAGVVANSEIVQFRWTATPTLCLVNKIVVESLWSNSAAFTAGFGNMQVVVARSWSTDGSGGTSMSLVGENGKLRQGPWMNPSAMAAAGGSLRYQAAALTVGTKTLDTDPLALIAFTASAANTQILGKTVMFGEDTEAGGHPLVLAQNEGWVLRITVPATGTWNYGFTTAWTEVTSY